MEARFRGRGGCARCMRNTRLSTQFQVNGHTHRHETRDSTHEDEHMCGPVEDENGKAGRFIRCRAHPRVRVRSVNLPTYSLK